MMELLESNVIKRFYCALTLINCLSFLVFYEDICHKKILLCIDTYQLFVIPCFLWGYTSENLVKVIKSQKQISKFYMYKRWTIFLYTVKSRVLTRLFRSTSRLFQITYEGDFWSLCTVTFWQKIESLISNER